MCRSTRLAVPLTHSRVPLAEQVRAAVAAGADLIELRVDMVGDSAAVARLLSQPQQVPFILTVRAAHEGGDWTGSEAERIALLEKLARFQPAYVDLEYATWQRSGDFRARIQPRCPAECGPGAEAALPKSQLILSYHNLRETPADLAALFDRLCSSPADVIKIVVTARDATDAWRVLAQLRRLASERAVIALAMGEAGVLARVLARKYGAFLTFAALDEQAASAPGQPTLAELRELYHWKRIGPQTQVFGVVGWPVTHSLSPCVHNAAFVADDLEALYLPMPVAPGYDDFAAFMDLLSENPWTDVRGLSVTIPHKEHALRWLDQRGFAVSELARQCGAVNTLSRTSNGAWRGDNTDARGALAVLQQCAELAGRALESCEVDVLGAGGVARAVVAVLVGFGCRVCIYNRSAERAQAVAQELRCEWQAWKKRAACSGHILVNCTSVGMRPDVDSSPMPAAALRAEQIVFDTIYTPAETRLLKDARRRGCHTVRGDALFMGQAVAQYEHWHGRPAPTAAMRAVL